MATDSNLSSHTTLEYTDSWKINCENRGGTKNQTEILLKIAKRIKKKLYSGLTIA